MLTTSYLDEFKIRYTITEEGIIVDDALHCGEPTAKFELTFNDIIRCRRSVIVGRKSRISLPNLTTIGNDLVVQLGGHLWAPKLRHVENVTVRKYGTAYIDSARPSMLTADEGSFVRVRHAKSIRTINCDGIVMADQLNSLYHLHRSNIGMLVAPHLTVTPEMESFVKSYTWDNRP